MIFWLKKVRRYLLALNEKYLGFLIGTLHPLFYSYRPENIYVLFSETRGGSTWLMEILVSWLNAFVCWEPFHPQRGVIGDLFGDRPKLSKEIKEPIFKTLNGKRHNHWTVSKNDGILLFLMKRNNIFIKIVRASRLLPEIIDKFDFKNLPVILIRHPAATLISQYNRFKILRTSNYNKPFLLRDQLYKENSDFINSLKSTLEIEFAIYCMNNHHLYNSNKLPGIVIHYENFLLNPRSCLSRIASEWELNIEYLESNKFHNIFKRESSEADINGVSKNQQEQLSKWRKHLNNDQLKSFQRILNHFNITSYSMDSDIPLISRT